MKKGFDNFNTVDIELATRRVAGTDYFYMMPPVNFDTMPGASEPVIDPNAGSGGGGLSAGDAVTLANTAGQLLLMARNRRAAADAAKSDLEKNIEAALGKRPVGCALDFFGLRNDCKRYEEGRANYVAQVQELEKLAIEAEAEANRAKSLAEGGSGDKLPTWAIVSIVGGSILVLGTIGFFIFRAKK
jgi:hypothetical protein